MMKNVKGNKFHFPLYFYLIFALIFLKTNNIARRLYRTTFLLVLRNFFPDNKRIANLF